MSLRLISFRQSYNCKPVLIDNNLKFAEISTQNSGRIIMLNHTNLCNLLIYAVSNTNENCIEWSYFIENGTSLSERLIGNDVQIKQIPSCRWKSIFFTTLLLLSSCVEWCVCCCRCRLCYRRRRRWLLSAINQSRKKKQKNKFNTRLLFGV